MHLAQVLPRLVRSGFQVAVHPLRGRGELADRLEAAGVEVIVPPHAGQATGRSAVQRVTRIARALVSLARCYRRWRPDVVHFFLPEAYLAGGLLSLPFRGFKRVMSRRSLNDYQAKHRWLAWIERRLHRRMDALVGNAQAVADQLVGEGAPPQRVHVI